MATSKEKPYNIVIDDLHPRNYGFSQAFTGKWTEQGVIAIVRLEPVERENWRPGEYRKDAYELVTLNPHTVSGRALGTTQRWNAERFEKQLRERMLAAMREAGWQEVSRTKYGQPIWQYQPVSAQSTLLEQKPGISNIAILPLVSPTLEMGRIEPNRASEGSQSKVIYRKTRAVTFTCQWCKETVTEQRFPSHTPLYCSKPVCKKEATKAKAKERVAAWRKAHPNARCKKV